MSISSSSVLTIISYKRHISRRFFTSWHVCLHILLLHQNCLWLYQFHIWRLQNKEGFSHIHAATEDALTQLPNTKSLLKVMFLCTGPCMFVPSALIFNINLFLLKAWCPRSSLWCTHLTLDAVSMDRLTGCSPSTGPQSYIHPSLKHSIYTKTGKMSM